MKRILIVDDDDAILDALSILLEAEGYAVTAKKDGKYINQLSKGPLPDLIILDKLLSGLDGRDLCRELKADLKTKHIPIIMISASPTLSTDKKGCDADRYLQKPFAIEELLKNIRQLLE